MKWNDPIRENQLKLEEEARKRGEARKKGPRKPWRDGLYGGLKGRVSVRAMDIIIWSIVGLIAAALIVGLTIR